MSKNSLEKGVEMKLKNYFERKRGTSSGKRKANWKIKKLNNFVKRGMKVLDVGCATGFLKDLIKTKVDYYGVDYNDYFVKYCNKKGLNVKKCDLAKEKLPFKDESFDIVWCSHFIEHLSTREQINAAEEISHVLKKGGVLFIFAPTPYHWYFWDDETHVRPCTHAQLRKLFSNFGLEVIEAKYSLTRFFPNSLQRFLRLPPLRWFLWETYVILRKR